MFMAEVYWDLEWTLQQQGFDFTYDKRLYDRLHAGDGAVPCATHLRATLDFQNRCARFLENHDEPRAADAFPPAQHRAAAVVTYLTPGLRFFHEGQLEGRKVHVSIHLGRRPVEPIDVEMRSFYERLLACVKENEKSQGVWRLCECRPAWNGNLTAKNLLVWLWETACNCRLLAAVNFSPAPAQCYVALPVAGLAGGAWELRDRMSEAGYDRDGDELARSGLYLDLPAWGYNVFAMTRR